MRCFHCVVLIILGLLGFPISTQAQLQLGFYSKICPKADKIVLDFVHQHIYNAPSLAAAFIRMHFHDCFVRNQVLTPLAFPTVRRFPIASTIAPGWVIRIRLDSEYAANLKANKCKTPNDNTTKVEMDPGSGKTFDLSYYTLLLKRRGLFESDAALTTNQTSLAFIKQLVQGSPQNFFAEFANSMEKMGRINVKTGSEGEIRKHCAVVN
ncbi:hypothetical protein CRYUN_Cryun12cG0005500 [Craigia yunnanensis]